MSINPISFFSSYKENFNSLVSEYNKLSLDQQLVQKNSYNGKFVKAMKHLLPEDKKNANRIYNLLFNTK